MSLTREIHLQVIKKVSEEVGFSPEWKVLDIGIGGDKEKPSEHFKFFPAGHFDTLDNNATWKPTIFGDICNPPIPSDTYDLVLCCQTLEHIWDTRRALWEIHRITKPGGTVFIDAPWMYEYHGKPDQPDDDFWRFSHTSLTRLCNEAGLVGDATLHEGIMSSILCKKPS